GLKPSVQCCAVVLLDVHAVPTRRSSDLTPDVAENSVAVVDLMASDADTVGGPTSFEITGGADAALFQIADGHHLELLSAKDFETDPHSYDVQVTASDGLNTAVQSIAVTLTDVNDNAPVFTSATSASEAENTSAASVVYTASATDPDTVGKVSFALSGDDAGLFGIDPVTGAVRFLSSPDYEAPADANHDNTYQITLHADDGVHHTTKDI